MKFNSISNIFPKFTFCLEAVSTTLFHTAFRNAIFESIPPLEAEESVEAGSGLTGLDWRGEGSPLAGRPASSSRASQARAVSAPTGETGGVGVALGVGVAELELDELLEL